MTNKVWKGHSGRNGNNNHVNTQTRACSCNEFNSFLWQWWIPIFASPSAMKLTAVAKAAAAAGTGTGTPSTTVHNHIENKRWLACSAALQASALTRDKGHVGCKPPTSQPVTVPVPKQKTGTAPKGPRLPSMAAMQKWRVYTFQFRSQPQHQLSQTIGLFLGQGWWCDGGKVDPAGCGFSQRFVHVHMRTNSALISLACWGFRISIDRWARRRRQKKNWPCGNKTLPFFFGMFRV